MCQDGAERHLEAEYLPDQDGSGQLKGFFAFLRETGQVDGAGKSGSALDQSQLFADLQKGKSELSEVFDTTLEGWVRVVDKRCHGAEGHTQRVTQITLRLCRVLSLEEHEIPHIRRGALLHDIGHLTIPDAILLKPGQLTKEEWEIMCKHPVFAYEMLAPISYLRPALAIPYCHHECWDGTGYPRGLKGEGIPRAARIFSVVDSWDALRSDRPYRKGWSNEAVLDYIESHSGVHFDPQVAKVFLDLWKASDPDYPDANI